MLLSFPACKEIVTDFESSKDFFAYFMTKVMKRCSRKHNLAELSL